MRKLLLLFTALLLASSANATTYYVANSIGSDSNNGTTTATPFKTIKHSIGAAHPGDTICINDSSTYNQTSEGGGNGGDSAVVDIGGTGPGVAGTAGNVITLMGCNGHTPTIEHGVTNQQFYALRDNQNYWQIGPNLHIYGGSDNTSSNYCGTFTIGGTTKTVTVTPDASGKCQLSAAYCLKGTSSPPCVGVGIDIAASFVRVTGVIADHNGSTGIAGNVINYVAPCLYLDHLQIDHNISYDNAFYSTSGTSGFHFFQLTNIDTAPGYHVAITNNYSWGNRMFVNETGVTTQGTAHSHEIDGNGFIIDDPNHDQRTTQNGTLPTGQTTCSPYPANQCCPPVNGPYTGAVLLENNVAAYNGATGMHAFDDSAPVDFFFNTLWHNVQSWDNWAAQVPTVAHTVSGSSVLNGVPLARFYDNIIVSDPKAISGDGQAYFVIAPSNGTYVGGYNDFVGNVANSASSASDKLQVDPQIANPARGNSADWGLRATSPLIGAGSFAVTGTVATDFYDRPRPNPPSIGCCEQSPVGGDYAPSTMTRLMYAALMIPPVMEGSFSKDQLRLIASARIFHFLPAF